MKTRQFYAFIFGILFLFPQFLVGQDWFKEGAEWVFQYHNGWFASGYEEVSITGDTLIENKVCKIFERKITVVDEILTNPDTVQYNRTPLIMFEQNDSVYFYFNNEFILCYDFTIMLGDYFSFNYANEDFPQGCTEEITYIPIDTGTIEIDGVTRRYQDGSGFDLINETGDDFRVIEGIGKVSSSSPWFNGLGGYLFLPLDYSCLWDTDSWAFCSYSDNEITYKPIEDIDCYSLPEIVNVKKIDSSNSKITLTPNPFQDFLQIKPEDNLQIQQIEIFDSQGKVVFEERNVGRRLDLSELVSGVYFVLVKTTEGVFSQKVVK